MKYKHSTIGTLQQNGFLQSILESPDSFSQMQLNS